MVDEPNYGLWGGPAPSGNPLDGNGTYHPPGNSTGNAPPASSGPAAAAPAASSTSFGDYDTSSLFLSANGHLFGTKRVISNDPANPGNTRYQFVTVDLGDSTTADGLAAISAATTIPADALTQQINILKVQNAQTQRNGNGSLIGQNADGSYSYYDRAGNIQTTSDPAALAAVGIQQSQVLQAQNDRTNGQRTQTQSQQYEAVGFNPNGTVAVRDYYGNVTNRSPQEASTLPGITAGTLQYLQQQGSDRNFLGSAVPNYGQLIANGQPLPNGGSTAMLPGSTGGPAAAPTPRNPMTAPSDTPAPAATPAVGTGDNANGSSYGRASGANPAYQSYNGTAASSTPSQSAYMAYMASGQPAASASGGVMTQSGTPPQPRPSGAYASTPASGTGSTGSGGYGYNASGFSGTQQGLQQANQGMSNYLQFGQNQFNIAHQAQDQQNTAYKYNQTQVQAQNAGQSRDVSGLGWSGIQKPSVAGY